MLPYILSFTPLFKAKNRPVSAGKTVFLWKTVRRFAVRTAIVVALAHLMFFLFILICTAVFAKTNPQATSLMLFRKITAGHTIKPMQYVPLSRLPKKVPLMFVRIEDGNFYEHNGIDFDAVKRAMVLNKQAGYPLFGGSTITQQLARSLFLFPHKNYFRKYLEALIALEMDFLLSKERILELYINNIEWGPGVFGIGAAAAYYYKKSATKLTTDEYRRLAAILTNPLKYTVWNFEKSSGMRQRYSYLVSRFP